VTLTTGTEESGQGGKTGRHRSRRWDVRCDKDEQQGKARVERESQHCSFSTHRKGGEKSSIKGNREGQIEKQLCDNAGEVTDQFKSSKGSVQKNISGQWWGRACGKRTGQGIDGGNKNLQDAGKVKTGTKR